jgi:prepilin-type N-terminal cleavage/methylation domain-containing protein
MLETPNLDRDTVHRRQGQGGFTLIELLIVIVILAILAAIVVFAVGSTTKNAVAASCSSDSKSVETAIAAYQAQNPGGFAALTGTNSVTSEYSALTTATAAGGPWLRSAPSSTHYTVFFNPAESGVPVYVIPYVANQTITAAIAAENNTLSSGSPTAANNNFDTNPSICATFS